MISPGLLPLTMVVTDGSVALDNVCAAPPMNVQSCIIEFPTTWAPAPQPVQHTHYHFTPAPPVAPRLSDDDVERIAKRVAELLKDERSSP